MKTSICSCSVAAAALLISGCASRYILSEREIEDARRRSAVPELGVYVSHRTVPVYERSEMHAKRIGREIDERSRRGRLRRPIGKNDMGLIVDEDLRNGARRLWVSFSLECRDRACSYGFVRGEDGRFHLVSLPERADYDVSKVFRSVVMGRHEMTLGRIRARSDANAVFRLQRRRKRRVKTVFLEVKNVRRKRTIERVDPETGN